MTYTRIGSGDDVKQKLTCCNATLIFSVGFVMATWLGIEVLCYNLLLREFPGRESSTASYIVYMLTCLFTVASLFTTLHLIVARSKLSFFGPSTILIVVFGVLSMVYYWLRRFELAQLNDDDDTVLSIGWELFFFRCCFVTSLGEIHFCYTCDWERDWRDTPVFLGYRLMRNHDIESSPTFGSRTV